MKYVIEDNGPGDNHPHASTVSWYCHGSLTRAHTSRSHVKEEWSREGVHHQKVQSLLQHLVQDNNIEELMFASTIHGSLSHAAQSSAHTVGHKRTHTHDGTYPSSSSSKVQHAA